MRAATLFLVLSLHASGAWAWDASRRLSAPAPSCAPGVKCEVELRQGLMEGQVSLFLKASGVRPGAAGMTIDVFAQDTGVRLSQQPAGAVIDGRVSVLIANAQSVPPGRYRFVIDEVGQGQFVVTSTESAAISSSAQSAAQGATIQAPPPAAASNSLPGVWYGIASTPGNLELSADGSYKLNGRAGGRYRRIGNDVIFDGALSAWNGGHASLKDDVLEFYWTNAEGAKNWFVFRR